MKTAFRRDPEGIVAQRGSLIGKDALASWGIASTAISTFTNFADPAYEYRPDIRWWWIHGIVDPLEIRREFDQIASAGFGGVEIQDVHRSIPEGTVIGDLPTEGWGGPKWLDGITAALNESNTKSLKHDLGFGPAWPGKVPDPLVKAKSGVSNQTIIYVQAWRVNAASNSSESRVIIDQPTLVDLTATVSNGQITWTRLDNATWLLLSAWLHGTGQVPEDSPHTNVISYVVDHFSLAGAQAATDFWDSDILSTNILSEVRSGGAAIMEDSLEMVTFPLDGMRATLSMDIPEGESLGFISIDNYRALAGAAGMAKLNIISNELGAYAKSAYGISWAKVLATLNPQFAAGVNQNVLHGISYLYSLGAQGVSKHDVAIFRRNGAVDNNYVAPYFTSTGAKLGWSANYVDSGLFELPTATVKRGRFAPSEADYSLLVIPGDPDANNGPTLTASTAKRILGFAEAGLPILFIGNWTDARAYGFGGMARGSTPVVKSMVKQTADLAKCGINPTVGFPSSNLVFLRRQDGDVDHYVFVANSSSSGISQTITLPSRSSDPVPVSIYAWTGTLSAVPLYQVTADGRLSIPLTLNPSQAQLVSVIPWIKKKPRYATSTTSQTLVYDSHSRLLIRATVAGPYSSVLDDGETYQTTISKDLPAMELKTWTLNVDDWQPADANGTTGNVTATRIVKHELSLSSLTAWSDIPELQDISGIGIYHTNFTLGTASMPLFSDMGAYIKLSKFNGSFRIKINDQPLPPCVRFSLQYDIGAYVINGTNTVEIEVAFSLLNRMRVVFPDVYGGSSRQAFGLVGVTIQPYTQAVIV
ncbi:hypothetical protein V502_01445 [Pseudogymnoascus sp. VKM F-4520 (FW-2644)]|nr:hypothetical protein V502_01445 [Pseudogymnoascus sp. VKM F-4520 (FW-2644)]